MRLKIPCDLENVIPWEKVINDECPLLGTLLDVEIFFFFFNGRMDGRTGSSKPGELQRTKVSCFEFNLN